MEATTIESKRLGQLMRAAHIAAGYATAHDAAAALAAARSHVFTERMLGSLERGETTCTVEFLLTFVLLMNPPGGLAFFGPACRADVRDYLQW